MTRYTRFYYRLLLLTAAIVLLAPIILPTWAIAQDVLPRPEQPFKGHIGRTAKDSQPDFPKEVQTPEGAPNVGKEYNWIQTVPEKRWFTMFRLYSPLEPWSDTTWRPGEIEEVK